MANLSSPGGDRPDGQATQQFWSSPAGPAGPEGPVGGMPAHLRRDRRTAVRWTAGVATALLLGAGGMLAGQALTTPSAPAANLAAAGPSGQAALLNATLASANTPYGVSAQGLGGTAGGAGRALAGAGSAPAAAGRACALARQAAKAARLAGRPRLRAALARCRPLLRRVARLSLLDGVDGQFTFRTPKGLRTLAYERGVIESAAPGSSLVVKAADGATWTWSLVASTVVRDHRAKAAESDLHDGATVWVGGPVVSGAKDARLIVLNPQSPPAG